MLKEKLLWLSNQAQSQRLNQQESLTNVDVTIKILLETQKN